MKARWVLAALSCGLVNVSWADTVVVTADHMIDVIAGKTVDRPQITITDGRITAVGTQGGNIPAGARRVDLPGMTLLPGFIDMHTHITSDPQYSGYKGLEFTDNFWTVVGVANAKKTIEAGFTTIRNVGSANFDDVAIKQGIDTGHIPGPRIVPATYAIGATGGHCDSTEFPPSITVPSPAVADGPDAIRATVRKLRKYGAEVIKFCGTGGVFSRGDTPGAQQYTFQEMQALIDEAHMAGRKVAVHAHGAEGIKSAIRAGVDTVEHASLIDDEGLQLAKKGGIYLSMDIYNSDYTQTEGPKRGELEEFLRKDREIAESQRENFRKAVKLGVKLTMGTDAGIYPHGDNPKQLAYMVRYGMTPMQAIQAATLNGADALGLKTQTGALATGLAADIIAVKRDPLEDIRALEQVDFVMKGGQVYKQP